MPRENRITELLQVACGVGAGEGLRHTCLPRSASAEHLKEDIPADLIELWSQFEQIRLFEDFEYGQWGLLLWGEEEALRNQGAERGLLINREEYKVGDVIVGKFLGDQDRVLVRCDPTTKDYGAVEIVLPIDKRADWPQSWPSLSDFLVSYIGHNGEKYWPH